MSQELAIKKITTMTVDEINKVRRLEDELLSEPQVKIPTSHILHAGMYSRTIYIPAGTRLVGSLMKIPTLLIINGSFLLYAGDKAIRLDGYNIFTGAAQRKQAGVALTDTSVTMIFPTAAKTIEEAENEFTDEVGLLWSRYHDAINNVVITGE